MADAKSAEMEGNTEGWIALCHICGKQEHTPQQMKILAERELTATGRWWVGERDICNDCAEKLKAESGE